MRLAERKGMWRYECQLVMRETEPSSLSTIGPRASSTIALPPRIRRTPASDSPASSLGGGSRRASWSRKGMRSDETTHSNRAREESIVNERQLKNQSMDSKDRRVSTTEADKLGASTRHSRPSDTSVWTTSHIITEEK